MKRLPKMLCALILCALMVTAAVSCGQKPAQQLQDLVTSLDQAEIAPIRYAEGTLRKGEEYYEFYPDKLSLWEMVKSAYCVA